MATRAQILALTKVTGNIICFSCSPAVSIAIWNFVLEIICHYFGLENWLKLTLKYAVIYYQ